MIRAMIKLFKRSTDTEGLAENSKDEFRSYSAYGIVNKQPINVDMAKSYEQVVDK